MIRTRDEQINRATAEAYYASRRSHPAQITQVPSLAGRNPNLDHVGPFTGSMRPVVVPHKAHPISWKEARARGEAYGRVLDGVDPKWPTAEQMVKIKEARAVRGEVRQAIAKARREGKIPQKFKRPANGLWWADKLADAVDRRILVAVPAHSRRGRALAKAAVKAKPPATIE